MKNYFYKIAMMGLLALVTSQASAQRFFSLVFDQLPRDFQLYARNDANEAVVPISGVIELADWKYISVVTYRNDKRIAYQRGAVQYTGGNVKGRFSIDSKIKAELADYAFEVYASKSGTDSSLIVRRNDVVAGDFYVINGQSNALARGGSVFSSKYCRTLARIPDDSFGYSPADTLWIKSGYSFPEVGIWGIELQKMILEKYQIPTCVLNGAVPGTRISEHIKRDANAVYTIYDLLQQRIRISGAKRIRDFFWLQGEDDALSADGFDGYPQKFTTLHDMWQKDFPMVDSFVVMQINVLFLPFYGAGALRDFQRRTPKLYPKTTHFATNGLPYYDGIHYQREGYLALAKQVFDFIGPGIYQAPDNPNRKSPNIRKVFYNTPEKTGITLVFDEGQEMKWPKDSVVIDRNGVARTVSGKALFFLDGNETQPAPVVSGEAQGNRVFLKLASASNARTINYLPAYVNTALYPVFPGPFLKNTNGLAAFTFHEVAIADLLAIIGFKSEPLPSGGESTISLRWQTISASSVTYFLERKREGEATFALITTYDGKSATFVDKGLEPNTAYTYRLRAVSAVSESAVAELGARTEVILALLPAQTLSWTAFPNPSHNYVSVRFAAPVSGQLSLFDVNGIGRIDKKLDQTAEATLRISDLAPGKYILRFSSEGGHSQSTLVVE